MSYRSGVWQYFTKLNGEDKAECAVCKKTIGYKGGSTSSMNKHLKNAHPTLDRQYSSSKTEVVENSNSVSSDVLPPPKKRQCNISSFIIRPIDAMKKKKIDEKVLGMIINDLQPISIVEDEGFIALCNELNQTYVLPSRTSITRTLLPTKYDEVVSKLNMVLTEVDSLTLTSDMWTSVCKTESYIALTAHFVSKEWKLETNLLGCCRFTGPHTAKEIADGILNICTKWNVEHKIHAIVTDNAANMKAAVHFLKWHHLPCLAHTLNLAVRDAINVIDSVRLKVKTIVRYFHKSTSAADQFEEMQKTVQSPSSSNAVYKLINDVETRWNSTYLMFERVCKVQDALVATLAVLKQKNRDLPDLNINEFQILAELCSILKPFYSITTELSAEKNVSCSKVIIIIRELARTLSLHSRNNDLKPDSIKMATRLLEGIQKRFPNIEENIHLSLAAILDPRFARYGVQDEQQISKCKRYIDDEISEIVDIVNEDIPHEDANIIEPDGSIWNQVDAKYANHIASLKEGASSSNEIRQYFDEDRINRHSDPLVWWGKREVLYPRLAKLAKKYLAMCATSVPSERVFSTAGELVSKKRNRLSSDNIEKIMFLNGNMKLF